MSRSCRLVAVVVIALAVITALVISALDIFREILNSLYLHHHHQRVFGKSRVRRGAHLITGPSGGIFRNVFNFLYLHSNRQQACRAGCINWSRPSPQSIERRLPASLRLLAPALKPQQVLGIGPPKRELTLFPVHRAASSTKLSSLYSSPRYPLSPYPSSRTTVVSL